jgi:hypothetical protein
VFLALATNALKTEEIFRERLFGSITPSQNAESVATLLPCLSPAEIVRASLGRLPAGLMPVLRRLGSEPLRQESYSLLVEWHQDSAGQSRRIRILECMPMIDQGRIDAVELLDPCLLNVAVLPFLVSADDARDLNGALATIRTVCAGATDQALEESAKALQREKTITAWIRSWLRKADQLPIPFEGDCECRPLRTCAEIEDAGLRFKNCLGSHCLTAVISGKISVVEFLPEPALALLARLSGGHWVIGSLHAPNNRNLDNSLSQRFTRKLLAFGAHIHTAAEADTTVVAYVKKYLGDYDPLDARRLGMSE